MAEPRKLVIEALAKVGGVTDLSKAVKALTRDASDLSKALGKVNIGGAKGPTDQAAITKQFESMLKQLRGIGVAGKDTAKVLGETMGRAIDSERQKLRELSVAIKDTEDRYKAAKNQVSQFATALKTGVGPDGNPIGDRDYVQKAYETAQARLANLGRRHAKQIGQANDTRKSLETPSALGQLATKFLPTVTMTAFVAQAVRQVLLNSPEMLNRLDMTFTGNEVRTGSVYGGLEAARRGGDLRYSAAIRSILTDKNRAKELRNVAGTNFRDYFDGLVTSAGGIGKADPNQIISGLLKFTANNPEAAERVGNMISATMRAQPLTNQGLQFMQGRADSDVNFFRLAGNHEKMMGGMRAVGNAGFSPDLFQSVVANIIARSGRGRSAESLRDLGIDITKLAGSGVDMGVLSAVAGMGSPFGSGRALAGHLASLDPGVANPLGSFLADNFTGGAGYTDGRALARALSAGAGGAFGAFNVQNNIAGLGGLQSLMSGSVDGFQRGRNLVTAMGVLGPNASLEGAQALASMNDMPRMLDILRGGSPSRAMQAMGITGNAARSFITRTLDSLASRSISQNDSSDLSALQRAVRGGAHMSDFLMGSAHLDGGDTDGALAAFLQSRMGMSENAAFGLVRDLRGGGLHGAPGSDGARGSPQKAQQDASIAGQVAILNQAMTDTGAAALQAKTPIDQLHASIEALGVKTEQAVRKIDGALRKLPNGISRTVAR